MIAYWYKTYMRRFWQRSKEKKGKVVTSGITAYKNFFLCFFVFVVCRFCTSKQSFGYVFLNLARCVFV